MNKQRNAQGITLVALVITIIVLVILVGVTMSTVINTGLIGNSKTAVEKYENAQKYEQNYINKVETMVNEVKGTEEAELVAPSNPVATYDMSKDEDDNITGYLASGEGSTYDLIIIGSGEMYNYSYSDYPAYSAYRNSGISVGTVKIGKDITSIGDYAFLYCTSLTEITIPSSVTSIGSHAFSDCSSLTTITIPNSVTSIGSYAFYNCSSLTEITIPSSVTSIGEWAFVGCTSLESVIYEGTVEQWNNVTKGEWWILTNSGHSASLEYVQCSDGTVELQDYN